MADEDDPKRAEERAGMPDQLLSLMRRIEPLKHLPRTGWVDREVANPESVAAHSWRLATLAWLVAGAQGLDADRAIRMALVHDLPEAITGDATPFDEYATTAEERRHLAVHPPDLTHWRTVERNERKAARERQALTYLLEGAPPAAAEALRIAWEEYATGSSPEARLVHQLDKLEAYLQGLEYVHDGRLAQPESLNSFQIDTNRMIEDPVLQELLAALEAWANSS